MPAPSPFIFPGSFCPNVSDCFPCNDLPTTNTSSEAPDVFSDFSIQWGNLQNNTPPLGARFSSNGCVQVCSSSVSQEDADLCAARQQATCIITQAWSPPPATTPGGPSGPTYNAFGNAEGSCASHCPDGTPFTFSVAAGTFVASSQALADREASSYACRQAMLHRLCLTIGNTECCLGKATTLQFFAAGKFVSPTSNLWELRSGALPPGFSLGSTTAGTTLHLSGTPTTAGSYTFEIRVTTPTGEFMQKPFTVCVVAITPATLPDGTPGVFYSQQLAATGCAKQNVEWTVTSGSLPDGMQLELASGLLTGTPTQVGLFTFTVQAKTGVEP